MVSSDPLRPHLWLRRPHGLRRSLALGRTHGWRRFHVLWQSHGIRRLHLHVSRCLSNFISTLVAVIASLQTIWHFLPLRVFLAAGALSALAIQHSHLWCQHRFGADLACCATGCYASRIGADPHSNSNAPLSCSDHRQWRLRPGEPPLYPASTGLELLVANHCRASAQEWKVSKCARAFGAAPWA